MAIIPCNEINQTYNELIIAFQDCNKIKNEDLRKLADLIIAVNTCANGGPDYNTIENDLYEPLVNTIVTYPANTFHAISVVVGQGTIYYNNITLPAGASINLEFTTLNQEDFTFTANSGSKVLVEYIIETI